MGRSALKTLAFATLVTVAAGAFVLKANADVAAPSKLWTEKTDSERAKNGAGVDPAALNKIFVELNQKMSPAVVSVYTKSLAPRPRGGMRMSPGGPGGPGDGQNPDDFFDFFFGNPMRKQQMAPREAQALGSGFVINNDGIIITNSHVVRPTGRNADSIEVKFAANPDKGYAASIVGVDETSDVAVLRLKDKKILKDLKVAPLGNSSKVQVGEWVVAIGNPYGHTHSVTTGIVSALGRSLDGLENRAEFIQTDASINPGNSGGPLINLYGEVIGINTAIDARAQSIGFAIPIDTAKTVIKQLIEKGEVTLGYIGVGIDNLSPQVARSLKLAEGTEGAILMEVVAGEPAAKAGLRAYDIVTEINGKRVHGIRDFMNGIRNLGVGEKAKLVVLREGRSSAIVVTVGKKPSQIHARTPKEPQTLGTPVGRSGLDLADLSPEMRKRMGVESMAAGAVVTNVAPGSAAANAGLAAGDVILEVDRRPVRSARDAMTALGAPKDSFLLRVQRGRAMVIVALDLRGGDNDENSDD